MKSDDRIDTEIRDWLARQEPPRPADRVVDEVLARVSVANQGPRPSPWLSLATVAAAVAVAAVGLSSGVLTNRVGPGIGPSPAPAPASGERIPAGGTLIQVPGRVVWSEFVGIVVGNETSIWLQKNIDGVHGMTRIDPATNTVTASVAHTWGMAFRGDELWVLQYGDECCPPGVLTRLDPVTGAELERMEHVVGYDLAIEGDTAWITNGQAGTVQRVDLASGEIVATVDLGGERDLTWPLIGGGYVWVGSDAAIYRIDPETNSLTASIEVEVELADFGGRSGAWSVLAFADGALWARIERTRLLWRIDPATAQVTDEYDVGNWQGGIAAGRDRLWVIVPGGVAEFDTTAGQLGTPELLPWTAVYDVSIIGDEVWVALGETLKVIRFPMPD